MTNKYDDMPTENSKNDSKDTKDTTKNSNWGSQAFDTMKDSSLKFNGVIKFVNASYDIGDDEYRKMKFLIDNAIKDSNFDINSFIYNLYGMYSQKEELAKKYNANVNDLSSSNLDALIKYCTQLRDSMEKK